MPWFAFPHSAHFAQIMAAVDAGKHVFCENRSVSGDQAKTAPLDALAVKC